MAARQEAGRCAAGEDDEGDGLVSLSFRPDDNESSTSALRLRELLLVRVLMVSCAVFATHLMLCRRGPVFAALAIRDGGRWTDIFLRGPLTLPLLLQLCNLHFSLVGRQDGRLQQ